MKHLDGGGRCRHILWPHRGGTIVLRIKENVYYIVCLKKHKLTFADFLQMLVLREDDLKQKNILIIRIYSR